MVSRQKAGRIGGITRVGPVAWLLAALLAFASPSYATVCLMRGCTVNTFGGKTSCNKIRSSTQLRTSCSTPTRPCCRYDSAPAKVAPANRSLHTGTGITGFVSEVSYFAPIQVRKSSIHTQDQSPPDRQSLLCVLLI